MKVKVNFEVDLPETFVTEREQPFEFATAHTKYKKAVDKNCSVVYKRTADNGDTELVSLKDAAEAYFLAKLSSDSDPDTVTYLKED